MPPPPEAAIPKPWSEASSWPTRKVPDEGEDVFIDVDMHIMIDLSPPCVGEIIIYGILEFQDDGDRELCAWQIAVYGELRAGTEASPFMNNIVLMLHGVELDPVMVMTEGLFLHNKVLASERPR